MALLEGKANYISYSYSESFLRGWLKETPSNNNHRCIFIIDNRNAFESINSNGFYSILITDDFTIKDFQRCVCGERNAGTTRNEYFFATSFENKNDRQEFDRLLDSENLQHYSCWKIFHMAGVFCDYLFSSDNHNELKKKLSGFIAAKVGQADSGQNETSPHQSNGISNALLITKTGTRGEKVVQCIENFITVLENDNRFSGKIQYDKFSCQTVCSGSMPWNQNDNTRPWERLDDAAAFSIIQSCYTLTSRKDFDDAVTIVSNRHSFHAVQKVLESIVWDGKPRVRDMLVDYLGAQDTDFNYQCFRLWMIEAVSRVYEPGCKCDYTIILAGEQGIGKSTFLRKLSLDDKWFCDNLDNMGFQNSAEILLGSWIVELPELKALKHSDLSSMKRFMTAQSDKFRRPYERRPEIFPRQCIFAGTTNDAFFLEDLTGNRRFLPIEVGVNRPTKSIFDDEFLEDARQAWAEILTLYKAGNVKLTLPREYEEKAREVQEDFKTDNGEAGLITSFLESRDKTCPLQIWRECLGEPEPSRPTRSKSNEIANIVLSVPGWQRMKCSYRFENYGVQKGFFKCNQGR